MPQDLRTLFDKLWDDHVVVSEGGRDLLYIDLHLVHEVTSPQAFEGLRMRGREVRRPDLTFATMDHNTPTIKENRAYIEDPLGRAQLEALKRNTQEAGITCYEMGHEANGIVHMVGPEQGLTQPGKTIVCGDSHTATHGALGALAFGIGTSEVEQVLATQTIWQSRPKIMGVEVTGDLPKGVYSKDIILALIKENGLGFAAGYAIEFYGETIDALSMEARMTLSNMAIEGGAKFGLIAPDKTTFKYLKGRPHAPVGQDWDRALEAWADLKTDSPQAFDTIIRLDVSDLKPQVTWGTNPAMAMDIDGRVPAYDDEDSQAAYAYTGIRPGTQAQDFPLDMVFIGSCTNGRYEDLKIAAEVMEGKILAPGLECVIVPGSEPVKAQCEKEGIADIFIEAGCQWREPGCSYCLAMNEDQVPPGAHCLSTSNRNFVGRQGAGSITYLASPYTAAKSAIEGRITHD